jgi:phosphoribosylanthranilate isomerase
MSVPPVSDAFTVLPSIHVADGRVVHLVRDGYVTEPVRTDPVRTALEFQQHGARWLHLVMIEQRGGFDVDAARRIIRAVDMDVQLMCRAGVVDDDSLRRALATGCARLNLGRGALADLGWCARAVARHGDRLGVSLPVRSTGAQRRVAGLGHRIDITDLDHALTILDRAGCARYVITNVSREGTLSGPDLTLFTDVCATTPAKVLAAGGISTLDELRAVAALAPHGVEGALIGRALYTDAFTLPQALHTTSDSAVS